MKLARSYMVESAITTVALQIELIKETKQDFTVKIHFLLKECLLIHLLYYRFKSKSLTSDWQTTDCKCQITKYVGKHQTLNFDLKTSNLGLNTCKVRKRKRKELKAFSFSSYYNTSFLYYHSKQKYNRNECIIFYIFISLFPFHHFLNYCANLLSISPINVSM